jgi:hypothetical protein
MHSALNAYLAQRPKHRPLTGDIGSRVHAKMMLKKGPYTLVYGLVIYEDLKIHHVIGGNTPRRFSDIKLYASLATDQVRRFRCRS